MQSMSSVDSVIRVVKPYREKAAKQRKEELKKEKDASDLSTLASARSSSSSQSQMIINLEIRKERRLLRAQEIERLSWLIQRAAVMKDAVKEDAWQLKLDLLYESPLDINDPDIYDASLQSPIDTPTPRSTPTPVLPPCSISICARRPFSPIPVSKLFQLSQDNSPIEQSNLMFAEIAPSVTSPYDVEDSLTVFHDSPYAVEGSPVVVNASCVLSIPVTKLFQLGEYKSPFEQSNLMTAEIAPSTDAVENSPTELDDSSTIVRNVVDQKKMFEQTQQRKHQNVFVQKLLCSFKRIDIPKDGHCLFHCFAFFFNRHGLMMVNPSEPMDANAGVKFSQQIVRNLCANELIRLDGKIPGLLFVCIYLYLSMF